MSRRRTVRLIATAVAATAFVAGGAAVVWGAQSLEGGGEADKARAVNQALNGGPRSDWIAATAAVRRYVRTPADADAQAGALLLRSLADTQPATRPPGTAEDAFRLMEAGAVSHPDRNAPIIESFLRYGVTEPRSEKVVIPPDARAAECWAHVEAHTEKAQACVVLRRSEKIGGLGG